MQWAGIVLRLVKELSIDRSADSALFQSVEDILARIDQGQTNTGDVMMFLVRLLAHSGVAPELERCARCGERAPEGKAVTLDTSAGSVVCRECGGGAYFLPWAAREAMRSALTDRPPPSDPLPQTSLSQMGSLLQGLAAFHLHKDIRPQLESIMQGQA
jgi:recombinational DNA repair protein (RecF pathway)